MASGMKNRGSRIYLAVVCLAAGMLVWPGRAVLAQNIVVDATPSHVANSFSPVRALGGAIDRLRGGTGAPGVENRNLTKEEVDKNTDTLLSEPVLKEILERDGSR